MGVGGGGDCTCEVEPFSAIRIENFQGKLDLCKILASSFFSTASSMIFLIKSVLCAYV